MRWMSLVVIAFMTNNLAHAAPPVRYHFTDLGTFGGNTVPAAINDQGQIVGKSDAPTGQRAFVWQHGVLKDLGTLPKSSSPVASRQSPVASRQSPVASRQSPVASTPTSEATAISSDGRIVGSSFDGLRSSAVAFGQSGPTLIAAMPNPRMGGPLEFATGVNSSGVAIGYTLLLGNAAYEINRWHCGRFAER